MRKLGLYCAALIASFQLISCGGDDPLPPTGPTPDSGTPGETPSTSEITLKLLATNNLTTLGLPHGSYSGITPIGGGKYAIVDDNALFGGISILEFTLNDKGEIQESRIDRTLLEGTKLRTDYSDKDWYDPEGIVYHPSTDTYFVSQEYKQQIWEYNRQGKPTGRAMEVPAEFNYDKIQEGFGFEALAYNAKTGLFWTTTEKALLKDKTEANNKHTLRLQSFGEDLKPAQQYIYETDEFNSNAYTHGVSDMVALDDGRLIVMEREVEVWNETLGEYGINHISPLKFNTKTKLFLIDPTRATAGAAIQKKLLTEFKTAVDSSTAPTLADYEGICIGPEIHGKPTLLLLADTQNGAGGAMGSISITMQEYLKVFVIE